MQRVIASKISDCLTKDDFSILLSLVNYEKRMRLSRFSHIEDIQRTLLGELHLRYLCHDQCGIMSYNIDYNKRGKPYIRNHNELFFNISHSDEWVVCVLSNTEVGIDIELVSDKMKLKEWKGIAEYFLALCENEEIESIPIQDRQRRYYHYWTQKEAFAKCTGNGITMFQNMKYSLDNKNVILFERKKYYFQELDLDHDYKAFVCSEGRKAVQDVEYICTNQIIEYMKMDLSVQGNNKSSDNIR